MRGREQKQEQDQKQRRNQSRFQVPLFAAALLLLAVPLSARAEEPTHLDLRRSIDAAIRGATLVLKQENNETVAGAALLQAYGSFLPDLRLTGSLDATTGTTLEPLNGVALLDATSRGGLYQLSSTLNLFRGFGDTSALTSASLRRSSAQLTLERARQQIALDVTQAFLQSILNDQLTVIARKNYDVSLNRLKLFRAQAVVGALATADVYRQEAQTASDESRWVAAKNQSHRALLDLLRRLRLDARKGYVLDGPALTGPSERPSLPSPRELVDGALQDRLDLAAQDKNTKAAESDIVHAASPFYPQLDLQGTFGGAGRVYSQEFEAGASRLPPSQTPLWNQVWNQHTASVALLLQWNIFTGFSTTADVRRANAALSNSEIDRDDQANEVVIEVKQAYEDLDASFDQLSAANSGVKAARKAFELLSGRYKLGASSFLDLITAQAALAQAEATQVQALVNYHLRLRALRLARGLDPA